MPDPGSGGGGQISHLIRDDGKSPKGLVCHLCSADILQMFLCGCLSGAMEIRLAPKETFSSVTLLPPFPSIPRYLSLLSLHPMSGMQDHVQSFLFPLCLTHYLAEFLFRPAPLYVITQFELRAVSFIVICSECYVRALFTNYCKECWDNIVHIIRPYCAQQTFWPFKLTVK